MIGAQVQAQRRIQMRSILQNNNATLTIEQQHWTTMDRAYVIPNFQLRHINHHEKLTRHKNFKAWKRMVEIDLKSLTTLQINDLKIFTQIFLSQFLLLFCSVSTVKSISHYLTNFVFTIYKHIDVKENRFFLTDVHKRKYLSISSRRNALFSFLL